MEILEIWYFILGMWTAAGLYMALELWFKPSPWKYLMDCPYDEVVLFQTYDGNVVQGLIYSHCIDYLRTLGYRYWMHVPTMRES